MAEGAVDEDLVGRSMAKVVPKEAEDSLGLLMALDLHGPLDKQRERDPQGDARLLRLLTSVVDTGK